MAHAIEVSHVTKVYRRYGRRRQFATLKSAIVSGTMVRDLRPEETFPALEDVSFSVTQGQTYGIVGRNGSGKSTALKVVAGITKPNAGSVRVEGRVSALIELGAGFHPEISGRENVFINGIMLGLSKREVARRFDEIVAFAELDDFIDAPVKTYSSGMYMRPASPWRSTWTRTSCWWTRSSPSATRRSRTSVSTSSASSAAVARPCCW